MQEIYSKIEGRTGKGLFVIGGFDQVASLLAHTNLESAILIDINLGAIEYARLRLALANHCDTREEYLSRLISRRIENKATDIGELVKNASDQLENINTHIRKWERYDTGKEEFSDKEINKIIDYLNEYNFDIELSEETTKILKKDYDIATRILNQTILKYDFAKRLIKNKSDYYGSIGRDTDSFNRRLSFRRLLEFLQNNRDNWLSSEESFKKVANMYKAGKIKFIWGNLNFFDVVKGKIDMSQFIKLGKFSIIYSSNIQEYGQSLKYYQKRLEEATSKETQWIWTSTSHFGKGQILEDKDEIQKQNF